MECCCVEHQAELWLHRGRKLISKLMYGGTLRSPSACDSVCANVSWQASPSSPPCDGMPIGGEILSIPAPTPRPLSSFSLYISLSLSLSLSLAFSSLMLCLSPSFTLSVIFLPSTGARACPVCLRVGGDEVAGVAPLRDSAEALVAALSETADRCDTFGHWLVPQLCKTDLQLIRIQSTDGHRQNDKELRAAT